jgi:hypothetical protein
MNDIGSQQLEERRSLRPGDVVAIIDRRGYAAVKQVRARNWAIILVDKVQYWVGSGNAVNQRLASRLRGRATKDEIDAAERRTAVKSPVNRGDEQTAG